jgi:hypothetical protein
MRFSPFPNGMFSVGVAFTGVFQMLTFQKTLPMPTTYIFSV